MYIMQNVSGLQFVILVIDSTDRERLSISKEELHKMLACEVDLSSCILTTAHSLTHCKQLSAESFYKSRLTPQ